MKIEEVGLPSIYDLLYDLKTEQQLQDEVDYLVHRLAGIMNLRRTDSKPLDDYVYPILKGEDTNARKQ